MDLIKDNKILRASSLKRGKPDERLCDRIKLKKVLGLTACSNAALDVSVNSGIVAYPAGCTVVLLNASKKLLQSYILNTSRKAITSVCFSKCGKYLATGECGANPAVKVWELDSNITTDAPAATLIAEFSGHRYAISCIAFSPTGKHLVSVGSQHDMIVNVFEWKTNTKIASNKVSAKVSAVDFSQDGSYFVTVGNRHVKYWYLEGSRKLKEPVPLMGRSAILGELRNNDFCAVACGKDNYSESTYAITRVGHLVEFNSRRLLDKYVECRTGSANCISVSSNFIFVGCAEAIIRIFHTGSLEYITTLPRTHYLGVDVALGVHINHIMSAPQNAKYPDTIALIFDESRSKVISVYNDHSLYVWDVRDVKRVGKSHSFLYHSACIWGVENVPYTSNDDDSLLTNTLPENSFLTCSSDDTIRVWALDGCQNNEYYHKNIYSKELLKVLYIDKDLNYIKDMESPLIADNKNTSYDGRNGVRSIKLSPLKNHLATGDRSGNIRIYDLNNSLQLVRMIEAHDSEVLCLEYTNSKMQHKLLASASRDRLIHVFDVDDNYRILQTLDDHSSSITSVKFVFLDNHLQMISCGADKSIMFRYFNGTQFLRGTNCSGKATLYDMEIDSNSKHILTACQDRNIRIYGTQNAKHTKTFKGSQSDDGSLIKICLDPSGIYIATSCTDKTLAVYDYYSNECMARMYGHSELVTGLKFSNDCKYLISASGDGCIFLWEMPHDMVVTMQARLSQQRMRSGSTRIFNTELLSTKESTQETIKFFDSPPTPNIRLSDVGQLPSWAKKKTYDDGPNSITATLSTSPSNATVSGNGITAKPRGRWAQRSQIEIDLFRSNSESPISVNYQLQTSDYNSSSSKDVFHQNNYFSEDSSIDSGMESKRDAFLLNKKKPTIIEPNENDGDIEDTSDGERVGSDNGLYYMNQGISSPTEFKVNAMDLEELRKSTRKHKKIIALTEAATGTGTSDTEDEGSTPSGENAERSLASTLGGSNESINHNTTTFFSAAIDGPGNLDDRLDKNRRSISTKHNIEIKTNYSKSYTNSKKEELMKVINDAKQNLNKVGYRSNLRGSQSISDLSYTKNYENSKSSYYKQDNRKGKSFSKQDNSMRRACSLSELNLTMSKANKSNSSKMSNLASRRKYSNDTIRDDSSSEETTVRTNINAKPIVPPRPKNLNSESRSTTVRFKDNKSDEDTISDTQSTSQLCSNIINMLNTTTNAVLKLHAKLKTNQNNTLMIKELENAIIMTQNMLTKVTNNEITPDDLDSSLENNDYLAMMNNCAEIMKKVNKHKTQNT